MNLITFLQGKKTYITTIATALFTLLNVFGILTLTQDQQTAIYALLAALFGAAIKAGFERNAKATGNLDKAPKDEV